VQRHRRMTWSLSEVLPIIVAFHRSGYRTFKGFYIQQVQRPLRAEFPPLVSYPRFVELMPLALGPLWASLQTRKGTCQGIAFSDSTPRSASAPPNGRLRIRSLTASPTGARTRSAGSLALNSPW
jgi:hypothetical protein